jgi:hypothetical protein
VPAAAQSRRHETGRVALTYLKQARWFNLEIASSLQHRWVPPAIGM